MRLLVGWAGRIAFWLVFVFIIANAVLAFWLRGDLLLAVGALVLAPLTFFLWPIFTGSWWLLFGALVAYWASTIIGGLRPVDWPAPASQSRGRQQPGPPSLGLQELTSQEKATVRAAIQRSLKSSTPFWDLRGVLREGVQDLEAAALREPGEWTYWNTLGGHYLQLGELDHALRAAQQGLTLRPNDQRSLYALATCLFALTAASSSDPFASWPAPNPQQSETILQQVGLTKAQAARSALELFEQILQLGVRSGQERRIVESRLATLRRSYSSPAPESAVVPNPVRNRAETDYQDTLAEAAVLDIVGKPFDRTWSNDQLAQARKVLVERIILRKHRVDFEEVYVKLLAKAATVGIVGPPLDRSWSNRQLIDEYWALHERGFQAAMATPGWQFLGWSPVPDAEWMADRLSDDEQKAAEIERSESAL